MFKKLFTFCAAILCFSLALQAQSKEYLQAGDKYFAEGDYYSAAVYYEKYLGKGEQKNSGPSFNPYAVSASANRNTVAAKTGSTRDEVIYKLGESYRNLHYHVKALPYYEESSNNSGNKFPLALYYYAKTLKAMEKFEEANVAFGTFIRDYAVTDKYSRDAYMELSSLAFIKDQKADVKLADYTLVKSAELNTEGGTYAPLWVDDNTLWITSSRKMGTNTSTINKLYSVDYSTGTAGAVTALPLSQPKDMQQGVAAITPNGNKIFLTRWDVSKGVRTASIYESNLTNGSWSDPSPVSALQSENSNGQQPLIMPDGKHIVFASDRTGGLGGYDLWMATLDEQGNVGNSVNMGSNINTLYDEQAPAYHQPTGSFIFSSNGRVGMGGYDFYYARGTDLMQLSEPKNFGYPVNSIKDDLYFTTRGKSQNVLENVIISSDREAACCLELFSLNKVRAPRKLSGQVVDCATGKGIAGAKIVVMNSDNNMVVLDKTTNGSGMYEFTMEEYSNLKATASIQGYFNTSINVEKPADLDEPSVVHPKICLKLIPSTAITVENVYYDFNKASLQVGSFASLDELVTLLEENPSMEIELSAHTDSKGTDEYNLKLSDERAKTVVEYLVSKGIDRGRMLAKGYGETQPIAPNENADGSDNPEGRQKNRRTEFKVLKN